MSVWKGMAGKFIRDDEGKYKEVTRRELIKVIEAASRSSVIVFSTAEGSTKSSTFLNITPDDIDLVIRSMEEADPCEVLISYRAK